MNNTKITLTPLEKGDREQFILDNQYAFKYGAMEEFRCRDDHFEEGGEIISRKTIENSIDGGVAYRIRENGKIVGGLVIKTDPFNSRTNDKVLQDGELRVDYIDVGKGDCILIRSKSHTVMIDTGYKETAEDVFVFSGRER